MSQPLMKCRRVFQALINIAIEELCETADALIAPVRMGVARPTAPFSLVASNIEAIQVLSSLFVHKWISRSLIIIKLVVLLLAYSCNKGAYIWCGVTGQ